MSNKYKPYAVWVDISSHWYSPSQRDSHLSQCATLDQMLQRLNALKGARSRRARERRALLTSSLDLIQKGGCVVTMETDKSRYHEVISKFSNLEIALMELTTRLDIELEAKG